MALSRAARVGDPIAHRPDTAAIMLGLAGAALGAVLLGPPLLAATGVSAITAAALQLVGLSLHLTNTGLIIGDSFRRLGAPSVWGHIVTGVPTVHVGEGAPRAANACPATKVDCHDAWVAQGSRTVFFEGACASRQADKTSCGGTISDGCATVYIGGDPATVPGANVDREQNSALFRVMNVIASFGSPGASLARRLPGFLSLEIRALQRADLEVLAPALEIVGAGFTQGGAVPFGRAMSATGNSLSLGVRWQRYAASNPREALAYWEAIARTPGTPARLGNALDAIRH